MQPRASTEPKEAPRAHLEPPIADHEWSRGSPDPDVALEPHWAALADAATD
jgi:hypothetical protein